MDRSAVLSPCGRYRYLLRRQLQQEGALTCLFIMLNPSTADAEVDDQTIRKCMKFAKAWGYDWLHVVNLFAWRATSPEDMKAAGSPIGQYNLSRIMDAVSAADLVVCAWGKDGSYLNQATQVRQSLVGTHVHYLQLNKDGSPKHPLYVKDNTRPTLWVTP
ncbi:hypothetical protein B0E46_15610 [Rhodanobacter sp. B04]|nr:hypothetical protein B0E46_15610 [Rhodanobacter sp. B04]